MIAFRDLVYFPSLAAAEAGFPGRKVGWPAAPSPPARAPPWEDCRTALHRDSDVAWLSFLAFAPKLLGKLEQDPDWPGLGRAAGIRRCLWDGVQARVPSAAIDVPSRETHRTGRPPLLRGAARLLQAKPRRALYLALR